MNARTWLVVGLAVLSAACELWTLRVAARELSEISARRSDVLTPDNPPVLEAMARTRTGLNELEVARMVRAVLNQWTPNRRTTVTVKYVAPFGVLSGLAAAIIAVT